MRGFLYDNRPTPRGFMNPLLAGGLPPLRHSGLVQARTALAGAVDGLDRMREQEGRELAADLAGRAKAVRGHLAKVNELAPTVAREALERLSARLAQLAAESLDPLRLAMSFAATAKKKDGTALPPLFWRSLENMGGVLLIWATKPKLLLLLLWYPKYAVDVLPNLPCSRPVNTSMS